MKINWNIEGKYPNEIIFHNHSALVMIWLLIVSYLFSIQTDMKGVFYVHRNLPHKKKTSWLPLSAPFAFCHFIDHKIENVSLVCCNTLQELGRWVDHLFVSQCLFRLHGCLWGSSAFSLRSAAANNLQSQQRCWRGHREAAAHFISTVLCFLVVPP